MKKRPLKWSLLYFYNIMGNSIPIIAKTIPRTLVTTTAVSESSASLYFHKPRTKRPKNLGNTATSTPKIRMSIPAPIASVFTFFPITSQEVKSIRQVIDISTIESCFFIHITPTFQLHYITYSLSVNKNKITRSFMPRVILRCTKFREVSRLQIDYKMLAIANTAGEFQ